VLFLIITVAASAFVNNTPIVLVLIPVVIRLAGALGLSPTRLLIPLSYAAILGGSCTLIGSSTNLLVDGVARNSGMQPFSIFEIAPVGIVAVVTGSVVLLLLGRSLLPDRRTAGHGALSGEMDFLSEVTLLAGSPAIGRTLSAVADLHRPGIRITGLRSGARIQRSGLDSHVLAQGDTVILLAPTSELLTLRENPGFRVGLRRNVDHPSTNEPIVAEAMVSPSRESVGVRITELTLGRRFGLQVLGAHRHGHVPGGELKSVILRAADKLILEGPPEGFDALAQSGTLVGVTRPSGRAYRRRQAPIALLALIGVVILAAFNVLDIGILAMIAVAAILLLRCIDNDEAWGSIDGSILILIFAMLIVGAGLENTGAIDRIVGFVAPLLIVQSPVAALVAVYVIASVLTEMVTNNAVAVILTPIVIALAGPLGIDPRAFVVAVMFGASASFATPIGYQTNTLVYGAGAYRFVDFLKIGIPMNICVGAASIFAITRFFPF
jgi:di/tricarboxylate transporter